MTVNKLNVFFIGTSFIILMGGVRYTVILCYQNNNIIISVIRKLYEVRGHDLKALASDLFRLSSRPNS